MIPDRLNFKHLKRTVSIADVLKDKGLIDLFTQKGNKLTGPCPVHGGDNRNAFVVNLSKNLWYCFTQCNAGGDVVNFVSSMDGKSYKQVAEYLADLTKSPAAPVSNTASPPQKSFRPFLTTIPLSPNTAWLKQKGIHQETAVHFEVGAYYGDGFLKGCIGVRLHDINGRPIGYAGRRLEIEPLKYKGKWKFPKGVPKNELLFNFSSVISSF